MPPEEPQERRQQLVDAALQALEGVLQAANWRVVGLRLGTIVLLGGTGYLGWLLWDLRPALEARLQQAPEVPTLDAAYTAHREEVNGLLLQAAAAQGDQLLALQLLAPYRGRTGITLWEKEAAAHRTPLEPGSPFAFGVGAAEQLGDSLLGLCGQHQENAKARSVLCAIRGPMGRVRGWLRVELQTDKPLAQEQLLDWWGLAEAISDTAWPRYAPRP
jgi:hypothetical protein